MPPFPLCCSVYVDRLDGEPPLSLYAAACLRRREPPLAAGRPEAVVAGRIWRPVEVVVRRPHVVMVRAEIGRGPAAPPGQPVHQSRLGRAEPLMGVTVHRFHIDLIVTVRFVNTIHPS